MTTNESVPAALHAIYFAGGCFWGIEEYFARMPEVTSTTAGYANGSAKQPSYEDVCTGTTGHAETVRVVFDPSAIDLATLCRRYFMVIDPLSHNRQGNDRGTQYRTGVYYADADDLAVIEGVFTEEQTRHDSPLAVELLPLTSFWVAEDYHQRYLKKNPGGYCHIPLD